VNEYGSSLEAKALIAERVNRAEQMYISERMSSEVMAVQSGYNSTAMIGILKAEDALDPSVMLRKGIYDKVAAKVVLQKYLNFY